MFEGLPQTCFQQERLEEIIIIWGGKESLKINNYKLCLHLEKLLDT